MELTMSLSFSLRALTAFFLLTEAWAMTSSMSLASRPVSSTSSPSSSSSSSFLASISGALPLSEWSWVCSAAPSCWESCWAAAAWACEFRSSILASPKMLYCVLVTVVGLPLDVCNGCLHVGVGVGGLVDVGLADDEEDLELG
jgi:hypothetical protein